MAQREGAVVRAAALTSCSSCSRRRTSAPARWRAGGDGRRAVKTSTASPFRRRCVDDVEVDATIPRATSP